MQPIIFLFDSFSFDQSIFRWTDKFGIKNRVRHTGNFHDGGDGDGDGDSDRCGRPLAMINNTINSMNEESEITNNNNNRNDDNDHDHDTKIWMDNLAI